MKEENKISTCRLQTIRDRLRKVPVDECYCSSVTKTLNSPSELIINNKANISSMANAIEPVNNVNFHAS